MKLIIIAVILILCGAASLSSPDVLPAAIISILAGVVIIIYKIVSSKRKAEQEAQREAHAREYQRQQREREAQAALVRSKLEAEERERERQYEKWDALCKKWKVVVDKHDQLLREIGVAYTVANNLNLPDSPQMQHVVDLCKQDIALAEMYRAAQDDFKKARIENGWSSPDESFKYMYSFPTFKRLSIIYEKQKDYDSAIAVCQRAVELGFVDDGTDGQMPGRIARLMRKKGNSEKKIKAEDKIEIPDIDAIEVKDA